MIRVAISRFTGQVIGKHIEVVNEWQFAGQQARGGVERNPDGDARPGLLIAAGELHFGQLADEDGIAGMQPNLTFNPLEPAATITAFIVQVALGDLPHGSLGYQTIFAAGLTLMLFTLACNIAGHALRL